MVDRSAAEGVEMVKVADPHPAEGAAQAVDGRAERSRRTRAAIVAAHLAMLDEGQLRPTAQQIAERCEVSVRTLWIHFADMDGLFEATAQTVLEAQRAAHHPISPELALDQRIDKFCRQRARLLEQLSPYAGASQLREPVSPMLQRYRAQHVRGVAHEIETLFAGELEQAAAGGRDHQELVHALAVSTTWGSWNVLRQHLGLGVVRARKVMHLSVSALLTDALHPRMPLRGVQSSQEQS